MTKQCIRNLCWQSIDPDNMPPNAQLKLGTQELSFEVRMVFYSMFIMKFDYEEFVRGSEKYWDEDFSDIDFEPEYFES